MFRITTVFCIAAIAALPSCVSQATHQRLLDSNERLQQQRDALDLHVKDLESQNLRLANQVKRLGANAVEADAVKNLQKQLRDMIARLGSGGSLDIEGVSVRAGEGGVIVQVQGEVLFDSGKAELSAVGRQTLERLAPAILRENRSIRVEGHTDSDPIVHSKWKTNLRLSSERAMSVAQYLIGAGFPADRVGISGYGEHRPIEEGDSEVAKAANRRVEILLLDD